MTLKQIIARIRALFRARPAQRPSDGPDDAPDSSSELTLTTPLVAGSRPPGIYRDDLLFVRASGYHTIREAGGRPVAHLLTPDDLVGRVPGLASDTGQPARDVATKVLDALPVFDVVDDVDPSVLTTALAENDVLAAPVHAVGMAGHWRYFPADEAVALSRSPIPTPPERDDRDTLRRPTVAVIDTGIIDIGDDASAMHTALLSGISPLRPIDRESEATPAALRGHAMFVGSLIRQVDPSLDVLVAALEPANLDWRGSDADAGAGAALTDELQLLVAVILMTDRLIRDGTETVALNLSLGAMAVPNDHDHDHEHGRDHPMVPPDVDIDSLGLGTRAAVDYWKAASWPDGRVPPIIAAAGNHDEEDASAPPTPLVPAAYSDVCAVVATDASGDEARFTFRAWPSDTNTVTAPGVSIVGCRGLDQGLQPSGSVAWAWSGTSFAAALVSAATAATGVPRDFDLDRVEQRTIDSHVVTVIR